ncbi:monofunctional biosynthetic peptidoglycan transglycosylase [Shimia sp. Alg240-R146]|uniref:monofunctional biosynthetic peptidoglycan transglycosylase n=1 Tax=Shimia sp. Alg240-R146 TaxID=2993449 RepID=UPI0022E6789B|nr:monofunctional biosynthetic peptidoglycan transglycosylase [Shimia sp. Alg240-R146]
MAKKSKKKQKKPESRWLRRRWLKARYWLRRAAVWAVSFTVLAVVFFAIVNPPITWTMFSEKRRLGHLDHQWTPMEQIAPVMARSVVAAEDANFCLHWGFDVAAIRDAIEDGGGRGASTLTQQTVKNVFLWQGRSYVRKALEAVLTPLVEIGWSKRRILEVYLNIAEFDEGVFGIEAAARHYFGVGPEKLSATQAARLAVVLPNPKARSASQPTARLRRRAAAIMDGAETIRGESRGACFAD